MAALAPGAWSTAAATIAIAAAVISALALVALHVLSPEFETECSTQQCSSAMD